MELFKGKTPAERNKMIAALLLPLVALVLILRMFFASDKPAPTVRTQRPQRGTPTQTTNGSPTGVTPGDDSIPMPEPVPSIINASYAPDAARNIFAFYVPPVDPTKLKSAEPVETPTPTPTPPPPLTLSSVQPANVFARTAEFTLEVSGDKFTPQTRVYVEGQEMPTTFRGAQQLSAQIPASLIASPGARVVIVHTPDNVLYSNQATVTVMPPPTPQYTFVGLLGTKHYSADKAMLKPTAGNDLIVVQRGDIVGGRFKVTSISERSVDFTDTQLNIKHSIPYTETKGNNRPGFPQPAQSDDDDQPEP